MLDPALTRLGLRPETLRDFEPYARHGLELGRVATTHRKGGVVLSTRGRIQASVLHKVRRRQEAGELAAHLTVGDWVAFEPRGAPATALVHEILPRHSLFVRKAPGLRLEPQPLAANVDVAFLVVAADDEPNPRRTERFLTMVRRAGAEALLVITKADRLEDPGVGAAAHRAGAEALPFLVVSGASGLGLEALEAHLVPGRTFALLGASGVGKSTLVNALFGATVMSTGAVRAKDLRGRHTTTERQLIVLEGGALLIDGPGIRELEPWDAEEGLGAAFEDVSGLSADCRFSDCRHQAEPGCAVRLAVEEGRLEEARWRAFVKLEAEARRQSERRRR